MLKFLPACYITLFAFLLLTLRATAQPSTKGIHKKQHQKITRHSSTRHQLRYVIINNGQASFGYDILDDNRIIIHQPSVPGLQGNKGFTAKEDAAKVAKLVIKKINNNTMPPTVTQQEIKSLKIKL